ncbi:MAG: TRAP transporter substrate-binding protein DctP [Alphaproteobacteria bacterium]|nr:TRAP transporter substrate-binding protein DctP [Alphaproteobacteria bacterium]
MRRPLGYIAAAAACLLALPALAQNVTMRISHQVPTGHHLHEMLLGFQSDVKQRSNGQIDVQIFPAEQLHKAGENHPAVARGVVEAALSVNQQWGSTIPEMNVVVIPYFFSELERIKKFPGSEAAKFLEKKLEEKGVRNLAWFYITRQAIYTSQKKPILALDDFKGIKIRGFNALADTALTALGASPSAMPGPEVYNALQTGVLDAGLTDLSAAFSRRFYEVQKFGTVTPSLTVYFHMYVNPRWFAGLTPAHRQILEEAARKAEQDAVTITEKTAADALVQLREKGMTLHVHTPAEIEIWRAAMQKPVMDAFIKAAPQDGPRIIELMGKL